MKTRSRVRRLIAVATVTSSLMVGLLAFSPAAPVSGATPRWTGSGPFIGQIYDLSVAPSHHTTVWAAAREGQVYRSTDSGKTWAPRHNGMNAGAPIGYVTVAPSNPNRVYAAVYGLGFSRPSTVYWTNDGGAAWHKQASGLTYGDALSLAVDPTNASVAYVTTYGGIFKTTNGGKDWHEADAGFVSTAYAILIRQDHPNVLFAYGDVLYKSVNGGGSWAPFGTGLTEAPSSFAVDPFDPARIYAGTYGSYVYETLDSGAHWHQMTTTGLADNLVDEVAVDTTRHRLYAVDRSHGLYRLDTSDGAATWTAADSGVSDPTLTYSLAVDPVQPRNVYVGFTTQGIARSTDRAASWTKANKGLTASHVSSIAVDPTDLSTAYVTIWEGGVWKTTDTGQTWHRKASGFTYLDVNQVVISPSDPQVLYASTPTVQGVYKSVNGGSSWAPTNTGEDAIAMAVDPDNSDTAWFTTSNDGVFKTIDGGDHWNPANTDLPLDGSSYPYLTSIAVSPLDSDVLYIGTYQNVFRTIDSGNSWTPAGSGLGATRQVVGLAVDSNQTNTVYAAIEGKGIYRTTNGGSSWSPRGLHGKTAVGIAIDPVHPKRLYATLRPGGIYRSLDRGHTWTAFNLGLTLDSANAVAVSPTGHRLWAGTNGGGAFTYHVP